MTIIQRSLPRWIVKAAWALFIGLVAGMLALPLYAAPKAKSRAECATYEDIALVAAAATRQGIEAHKLVAMLPDIYDPLFELRGDEARAIAAQIVVSADAWQKANPRAPPHAFSQMLAEVCIRAGGDMDAILGAPI